MFGYSSLSEKQITMGIERLAAELQSHRCSRDERPATALSC
jgi:hypothetical protein